MKLPDGTPIELRPIRAEDKQTMLNAFAHLSDESRYRRFLGPHPRLSESELRYLTEVDHRNHEAIVAISPVTHEGLGVARYIVDPERPDTAEMAVTVVDAWQGRGVGTALLNALVERARQNGIRCFGAFVLASNASMITLLHELGKTQLRDADEGINEYIVELPPRGIGDLAPLLRHAAANVNRS